VRNYFEDVALRLESRLRGAEHFTAVFSGEISDFVRANAGRVRQAGRVQQQSVAIDWIDARRHATCELALCGDLALDGPRLDAAVDALREQVAVVPGDPHLLYATDVRSTEVLRKGRLPEGDALVEALLAGGPVGSPAAERVGIGASGAIVRGFANSLGQRNWFFSESFHLDWSLHAESAAVKASYAGTEFDASELARRDDRALEQMGALTRTPREVVPGRYRTYLAPSALEALTSLLGWGGFGLRAQRTKASPLLRLVEGEARLAEAVALRENGAAGIAPNFERAGFLRPESVSLVQAGRHAGYLVSPRTAVEYGAPTNGAEPDEAPTSLEMDPGPLAQDDVLRELGTGLYVSNLWYLNYSDRPACRTTGMTRFATFWVERGQLVAPVAPMRFDDTLYHLLGGGLIALTREREEILDPETYGGRSTRSARLPGALVDGLTFTL